MAIAAVAGILVLGLVSIVFSVAIAEGYHRRTGKVLGANKPIKDDSVTDQSKTSTQA